MVHYLALCGSGVSSSFSDAVARSFMRHASGRGLRGGVVRGRPSRGAAALAEAAALCESLTPMPWPLIASDARRDTAHQPRARNRHRYGSHAAPARSCARSTFPQRAAPTHDRRLESLGPCVVGQRGADRRSPRPCCCRRITGRGPGRAPVPRGIRRRAGLLALRDCFVLGPLRRAMSGVSSAKRASPERCASFASLNSNALSNTVPSLASTSCHIQRPGR